MTKKPGFLDRQIARFLPRDSDKRSQPALSIPTGDRGRLGERDDYSVRGDFLERYEHLLRHHLARGQHWKKIVEIGCGTGYGSSMLADEAEVTAIDISKPALAYAKKVHPGPEYVLGSATAVPLSDESSEALVSFEVIEHLRGNK